MNLLAASLVFAVSALLAVPVTAALLAINDADRSSMERALIRAGGFIVATLVWVYWLDEKHGWTVFSAFLLVWALQIAVYVSARVSAGRAPIDD